MNSPLISQPLVISVLAANGQQSSSIIAHLLSLGPAFSDFFRIRAVVRDATKYASPPPAGTSHQTSTINVDEVVTGDMSDVESLKRAFQGTDVVWAMTNPDPTRGMQAEVQLGKNIVDAFISAVGQRTNSQHLPLLLFSSAVDAEKITGGEFKMINATAKAKIESYIHSLTDGQQSLFKVTFIHPGMFMQNFSTYQKVVPNDKGVYQFIGPVRPDVQLPFVDITDLGPLVWHLLQAAFLRSKTDSYEQYDRATIRLFGEMLSYPQVVEQFSQVTGQPAEYEHLSVATFLSRIFGGTEEEAKAKADARNRKPDEETAVTMIGDMYNLINRYGYYGGGSAEFDDYHDDIRTKKLILQQSSRRTTWKQHVHKYLYDEATSRTMAKIRTETVLTLPTNFPPTNVLNAAEQFLYAWFSYFISGSKVSADVPSDFEEAILQPYFHPDAVVEFPYLPKNLRHMMNLKPLTENPDDDGAILDGHAAILGYFKEWRRMFFFEKGQLQSLSALSTSSSSSPRSAASQYDGQGTGAMGEVRLTGTVAHGGPPKPYVQDYVSIAHTDAQGKIIRYQEYWAVERFS